MSEPLAFFNGRVLPASQLSIAVYDAGFVQGVTVSEQMRTFGGCLFRVSRHLQRLQRSLEIVGVDPGIDFSELTDAATQLAENNHRLLAPGDDLGLVLIVTPGPYASMAPAGQTEPTIAMHTHPLPFGLWCDKYEQGQTLVVTDIRQVPTNCWPAELKCRSRMHYYLADRQANLAQPGARALLLDQRGQVVEASTANVVVYRHPEGFISPPREHILPGVSIAELADLSAELGLPFGYRELTIEDVASADEVLISSTSPCLLPVVSVDGRSISGGRPGDRFRQLLDAWSRRVGVDIVGQAREFRERVE